MPVSNPVIQNYKPKYTFSPYKLFSLGYPVIATENMWTVFFRKKENEPRW
jgi:hypothetical protein